MANLLNQYTQRQTQINETIAAGTLQGSSLLEMQEINYRICVLETARSYCQTAPRSMEPGVMGYHYQLVDAFIHFLQEERKFGLKVDESGKQKRETAAESLNKVIGNQRRRFSNYRPASQDQYAKDISTLINTVLPVWIAYRNTYISL